MLQRYDGSNPQELCSNDHPQTTKNIEASPRFERRRSSIQIIFSPPEHASASSQHHSLTDLRTGTSFRKGRVFRLDRSRGMAGQHLCHGQCLYWIYYTRTCLCDCVVAVALGFHLHDDVDLMLCVAVPCRPPRFLALRGVWPRGTRTVNTRLGGTGVGTGAGRSCWDLNGTVGWVGDGLTGASRSRPGEHAIALASRSSGSGA